MSQKLKSQCLTQKIAQSLTNKLFQNLQIFLKFCVDFKNVISFTEFKSQINQCRLLQTSIL